MNLRALSFFLFLAATFQAKVNACDCSINPSPLDEAENASAVFAGKVISDTFSNGESVQSEQVVFDVLQSYKGIEADENEVTVLGGYPSSCGVNFRVGDSYLIYAHGPRGNLETSLCTRTRHLSRAEEDLELLESEYNSTPFSLAIRRVTSSKMELALEGVSYRSMVVESSADLQEWSAFEHVHVRDEVVVVANLIPEFSPEIYFRARQTEVGARQGIYGLYVSIPGVCFPDGVGGCLNVAFPTYGMVSVREFKDTPDIGRSGPIIRSLQSGPGVGSRSFPSALMGDVRAEIFSDEIKGWMADEGLDVPSSGRVQALAGNLWVVVNDLTQQIFTISEREGDARIASGVGFRIPLPTGDYCIWDEFGSCTQVEVSASEWKFVQLIEAIP